MSEALKLKRGRKRIGQPISITLTPEQKEWIDKQIEPGGTRTEVIRKIIQIFIDRTNKRSKK